MTSRLRTGRGVVVASEQHVDGCLNAHWVSSNRHRVFLHDSGSGYLKAAQEPLKPAGRVALLLTSPVQPLVQNAAGLLEELLQALGIAPDSIIIPIASIFAGQGFHCVRQLLMPAAPNPFGEGGYALVQFLARSAPLHQRTTLTTKSPVKLETQKVEAPVVRPSISAKT